MIKNILAVAIVVALSACSSSSDSDNDSGQTNNEGQQPVAGGGVTPPAGGGGESVAPPGGGAGPVTETKAGSYVGNFGGSNGVYVINNDNQIAGLAVNPDGSAQSLFGDLGAADAFTGSLRQYIHQESRPDANAGVFGAVASAADPLGIEVNIVNGQTIDSTATSPTAVALVGTEGSSVAEATVASLAGDWSAVHSFCGADFPNDCQLLTTSITFTGDQVTGSTLVEGDTPVAITGAIAEFGDAALVTFDWGNSSNYNGVVFFTPDADGRIVFIGENAENDPPTIAALLSR